MRLSTGLVDEWDDDACLGSRESFDAWAERHGLSAVVQCGTGYEWWLAGKLNRGVVSAQSKVASEKELRARGWFEQDGRWERGRPEPLVASGEFEACKATHVVPRCAVESTKDTIPI